jgi:hypothetical protein
VGPKTHLTKFSGLVQKATFCVRLIQVCFYLRQRTSENCRTTSEKCQKLRTSYVALFVVGWCSSHHANNACKK